MEPFLWEEERGEEIRILIEIHFSLRILRSFLYCFDTVTHSQQISQQKQISSDYFAIISTTKRAWG
jgi:hypothetical protein